MRLGYYARTMLTPTMFSRGRGYSAEGGAVDGGAVDGGHRWSNKQDTRTDFWDAICIASDYTWFPLHSPLLNVGSFSESTVTAGRYSRTRTRCHQSPSPVGWRYLSNAASLMRPHLSYVFFAMSRVVIMCYIILHAWRKPALDKWSPLTPAPALALRSCTPGIDRAQGVSLGEHKPGRIKPGRIKRAALSLQNNIFYMFCFLIRPRLYASDVQPREVVVVEDGAQGLDFVCFVRLAWLLLLCVIMGCWLFSVYVMRLYLYLLFSEQLWIPLVLMTFDGFRRIWIDVDRFWWTEGSDG